jgi:hypothetical protein
MMRNIPLATPGLFGELFWLLAHPLSATFATLALLVSVWVGYDASHILPQTLTGALVFSGLAHGLSQSPRLRSTLWIWALAVALICCGVALGFQSVGTVYLLDGVSTEAYQRGLHSEVDFHFGQSIKLTQNTENIQLQWGSTPALQITRGAFFSGQVIQVGPWSLSHLQTDLDEERLQARLKISPRDKNTGQPSREVTLREGDRHTSDGAVLVTALAISPNRGGEKTSSIGAAIELLIEWEGGRERAWHYLNGSSLNEAFGHSPMIIEIKEIRYAPRHQLRVQSRGTTLPLWGGLSILILVFLRRLSARLSPPQALA